MVEPTAARVVERTLRSYMTPAERRAASVRKYLQSHKAELREKLKAWCRANPEKAKAQQRRWRESRPAGEQAQRCREYRLQNLELEKERNRKHQKSNRARYTALEGARRARQRNATPLWVNMEAVREIYKKAAVLGLQVDHIVPISSNLVCGLHWEGNLQLLTAKENASKKNRRWPDMPKGESDVLESNRC